MAPSHLLSIESHDSSLGSVKSVLDLAVASRTEYRPTASGDRCAAARKYQMAWANNIDNLTSDVSSRQ